MIAFACPHCGAPLRIDDSMAGRSGACPSCSRVVQVPASAERASGQRTLHPPAAAEDTAPAVPDSLDIPDSLDLAPSPDFPFLASPYEPDELGRLGPYRVLKVLGTGRRRASSSRRKTRT